MSSGTYAGPTLSAEERERLQRVFADLLGLAGSQVPAVKAAARVALAHVAQALNGQGLDYELYSNRLED
jgi:hypothetical protein